MPVIFSNLTSTSDIDGEILRGKFTDYYNKRSILFQKINENAVHQNQVYNGVKINSTDGVVVTTNDNKFKTTQNATEGIKIEQSSDMV